MARQMSTPFMEARIRFSDTARMASAASSASQTRTSMADRPAAVAALRRRSPATIISPAAVSTTRGGWMMPTARMEATSWSSIALGAAVRRGLFGFERRLAGSTLRSSAMVGSYVG